MRAARWIAGVLFVVALLWGGEWAIDAAFHPWAHAVLGASTLTGEWTGAFEDVHGVRRTAQLELRRTMTPAGYYEDEASPLTGALHVCGGETYEVSGRPEWWRGKRFSLRMRVTAPAAPRGYFLREAIGEWDGDGLTLRAKPVFFAEDGGMFASGSRFPLLGRVVLLTFRRGGDVPNGC